MIVLDASVIIAQLDPDDAHHHAARRLLESTDGELAMSTITLGEVLVTPTRTGHLEIALEALDGLGIAELPLREHAAVPLATLRAETGLKLPDCCVLLAAQEARATAVLTFDRRLEQAAAELLG